MVVAPLIVCFPYDFLTTDGTLYENAVLIGQDEDGVWIQTRSAPNVRPAHVFIAAHELEDAT